MRLRSGCSEARQPMEIETFKCGGAGCSAARDPCRGVSIAMTMINFNPGGHPLYSHCRTSNGVLED
jgi:hypothetical protein